MTKPSFRPQRILWLDLEMTGLDPVKDRILEVAAIVTDWDYKEIASFEVVVHQSDEVLAAMNEWCVAQHGASGLSDKVRASTTTEQTAEQLLIDFAKQHVGTEQPILLAGNSIHMDRRFIEQQWKTFDALLHYRMLDVSAWKVVFEGRYNVRYMKPDKHRALDDIRGSIEELQHYTDYIAMQKEGQHHA